MKEYILDHFSPYILEQRKCQTLQANDWKGVDPNRGVRPTILRIYEADSILPDSIH